MNLILLEIGQDKKTQPQELIIPKPWIIEPTLNQRDD